MLFRVYISLSSSSSSREIFCCAPLSLSVSQHQSVRFSLLVMNNTMKIIYSRNNDVRVSLSLSRSCANVCCCFRLFVCFFGLLSIINSVQLVWYFSSNFSLSCRSVRSSSFSLLFVCIQFQFNAHKPRSSLSAALGNNVQTGNCVEEISAFSRATVNNSSLCRLRR